LPRLILNFRKDKRYQKISIQKKEEDPKFNRFAHAHTRKAKGRKPG
jgi:hypothetical protein